jgi:hypothetical protein
LGFAWRFWTTRVVNCCELLATFAAFHGVETFPTARLMMQVLSESLLKDSSETGRVVLSETQRCKFLYQLKIH